MPVTPLQLRLRPAMPLLQLRSEDEVAVAMRDLAPGEQVATAWHELTARGTVRRGHKIAVCDIAPGAAVRKYGQVIGYASAAIAAGEHVHTHNLGYSDTGERLAATAAAVPPEPLAPRTFQGYRRADGKVGTRNYLGILTSVNCSASVARMIAAQLNASDLRERRPDLDGAVAITHSTGCGMTDEGMAIQVLRRTLAGYAAHPNFAAVLMVGLGCEVNQLDGLGIPDSGRYSSMTIQESGGTAATVRAGVAAVEALVAELPVATRVEVPASELVLGLKCGGSDGYSGITANPALGVAADAIVAMGGRAVLCETPEIYGAEHLLAARATSPAVADRLMQRIDWWRAYVARHEASLDNNPSPGNKAGGITTILEKSLGAVAKAGSAPLSAVYEYAEPITVPGLGFMDTPGYDPVSVTGMIAGGATVVCFTTGRGSVFGSRPTPSLKLSTNTELYERMPDDIDVNCGQIATGDESVEQAGARILDAVLAAASGQQTRSEELGMGQDEFVPWTLGPVV